MTRKPTKPASPTETRSYWKPAAVCTHQPIAGRSQPRPATPAAPCNETEEILFALARAVEQRDRHTAGHCERLALISVALGVAMKLEHANLLALYRGGYLHDIGKVGIPDSILFKPGKLTAEEWVTMRSHPARGQDICRHLKSLRPVLPIIRHHHERWDGSGYPDGLRGEQIPVLARVVQIADIYDALTGPRPYKPAYSPEKALAIIEEETANGWRDPQLVELFLRLHQNVISKIACLSATDSDLLGMQGSLVKLGQFLDSAGAPWEMLPAPEPAPATAPPAA